MKINVTRIQLVAALEMDSLQYQNFIRSSFEFWAMIISEKHRLVQESITTNASIWMWYKEEFECVEELFFKENKEYIIALLDKNLLQVVFMTYIEVLENNYPSVLIKNYCNGKNY